MNILVTGAGGFLGFHIAQLLKEAGHEVFNFSRSHNIELDTIKVESRLGDLSNKETIFNALENIEAVFHVASKVGMWGTWESFHNINTIGTQNLIDSMLQKNIKFLVYTSTPSVVFSKRDIMGLDESMPYPKRFLNHYSKSKAMAEKIILGLDSNQIKSVSIRPHLIYGERDLNLIPRLVKAKKEGRLKIIGNGQNLVDVIYVENAAKAHIDAFKELQKADSKVTGKAYFIGQDKPVKLWSFFNELLDVYKEKPLYAKISLRIAYTIGFVLETFYKLLNVSDKEPPMTRFVALNLAKSHYFSHQNAINDFNFTNQVSTKESLIRMKTSLE